MLEGATKRAFLLKDLGLDWLGVRQEFMGSDEGLQGDQARRTSTNDSNTHVVLPQSGIERFSEVKLLQRTNK
jgi:hypothetical protein